MLFVPGTAALLTRPARPASSRFPKPAWGVTCQVRCPDCASLYQVNSPLYERDAPIADSRGSALRHIVSKKTCTVCKLASTMPKRQAACLSREVFADNVSERKLPSWSKGLGLRYPQVLIEEHKVLRPVQKHLLVTDASGLPTDLVTLRFTLERGVLRVKAARSFVCGVCGGTMPKRAQRDLSAPSGDLKADGLSLLSTPEGLSRQLGSSSCCQDCGSWLSPPDDWSGAVREWLEVQLGYERVKAKLEKLQKQHQDRVNQERIRLHAEVAPDCATHAYACRLGTHGPELAERLHRLTM